MDWLNLQAGLKASALPSREDDGRRGWRGRRIEGRELFQLDEGLLAAEIDLGKESLVGFAHPQPGVGAALNREGQVAFLADQGLRAEAELGDDADVAQREGIVVA